MKWLIRYKASDLKIFHRVQTILINVQMCKDLILQVNAQNSGTEGIKSSEGNKKRV